MSDFALVQARLISKPLTIKRKEKVAFYQMTRLSGTHNILVAFVIQVALRLKDYCFDICAHTWAII